MSRPACTTCLELWPVHGHAGPVGATPPAQIFFITSSLDALLQVSVELVEPTGRSIRQGRPQPLELQMILPRQNPEELKGASMQRAGHTCHCWTGRGVDARLATYP